MRGLTVIVASPDRTRFRSALGMVAAQAALGGRARLFLDEGAAVLLATPPPPDAGRTESGLPSESDLLETALALGATILVCQSGAAATGLDLGALSPPFDGAGMTTVLATLEDDRLVAL